MIGKVFLTESGRMRKTGAAALALCAGAMLVCGLISVGSAARAELCARIAFGITVVLSYAVPLFFLAYTFWNERYGYFRIAGVQDKDVCGGRLLALFVWTAAFLAAEMLLVTLFDALFFIGREQVRNVVPQGFFMLSLRAHGAERLLFAASAAVSMCLVYYCYDAVKCAVKRPTSYGGKTAAAVIAIALILLYQIAAFFFWQGSAAADLSLLASPDSVIPLYFGAYRNASDAVKDYHAFAAPVLNVLFIAAEGLFVLTCVFFKKWRGRCYNEIGS